MMVRETGDLTWIRFPIEPEKVGLTMNIPKIKIHRGFGRNYESIHKILCQKIQNILSQLSAEDRIRTWIWFTGHSRGAAVASLAAFLSKPPSLCHPGLLK